MESDLETEDRAERARPESVEARGQTTGASISAGEFARPIDARQLAGQINSVATGVLSGAYTATQLDMLRLYAGMVRSIAQLMTAETSRARQARELPDLTLPDIDEE